MNKALNYLALGITLITFSACSGGSSRISTSSAPTKTISTSSKADLIKAFEAEIFQKINDVRTNNGKSALILDTAISDIALPHGIYMARKNAISHDKSAGRFNKILALEYTACAENVAYVKGYADSLVTNTLVSNWKASKGHFKNIIGDFTHTGVNIFIDSATNKVYATQLFAKKSN